ncbi:CBS domain-containing protein [Chryseolinea lacunae]|uniref:CBS domain-containing protein n=1 Tax=Chryseolinea lacunae TaxID=2801331 RepID=A0ABS1KXS2_9BACT|nr:CBS domain-containing protein [Chryseolinea lacunae]MBL0744254.1 CBS domain-containing protein [Chryseolinea lacunae]
MGKVRNILQNKGTAVFSVEPTITVYHGLELMVEQNVGGLLICENGKLVGIFTERDYARKLVLKGKNSKETLIRELMSERPITVCPDDSIEECMQVMTNRSIRHLPVLDGETLVGIISIGDIIRYMLEEQRFIIENLEQYITH